ncbi:NrdH-like glutaredoxin [Microbacterium phage GardenState]|uniref:Thioredoxin n=2 Tax=Gardenstatevirus TaxID=3425012 RepID=A0A4Y6E724_9CAUD|nr:thioredoxin [Microbacterium phage IAmGroot]QOI66954.1 NrdH-like glutaredoxin [Microbacterium phage GardenState]
MARKVTLYTKALSFCGGCKAAKRFFETRGFTDFDEVAIDLPENADTLQALKDRGLASAPVLVIEEDGVEVAAWAGFQPHLFDEHFPRP